jgi:hypothetical protein
MHLRHFNVGDWVWVLYPPNLKEKLGRGWTGPYLITKKWGEVNYEVQKNSDSRKFPLHVDHIKAYTHETPESWIGDLAQSNQKDVAVQTDEITG